MTDRRRVIEPDVKPGDTYLTAALNLATFVRERDDNGEFRYVFRLGDESTGHYNAAGEMPLSYDPGRFITGAFPCGKPPPAPREE